MSYNPDPRREIGRTTFSEADGTINGVAVAEAPPAVRAAFLHKVYLTLTAGVAVSMGTAFWLVTSAPELMLYVAQHYIMTFIIYLAMAFAASAVARIKGVNIVVYLAFTAVTGALIAPLFMVAIAKSGDYSIIWNALGLTGLVFGGLTAFVFISGKDFSFLKGTVWVGLLVLIGFMVAGFFFKSSAFSLGVTAGGLLLFGLFVLYDTSVIMRHLGPSEWVAGALRLFVDFINLFIRILSLLSRSR